MRRDAEAVVILVILGLGLFSINAFAATTLYTYDNSNRLTRVERDDNTIFEYTYDEAGNRLSKTVTPESVSSKWTSARFEAPKVHYWPKIRSRMFAG